MTPERWRQVTELFHAALARDESQRAAFLSDACAGNQALRHEVESLLEQKDSEGFPEGPSFEVAANSSTGDDLFPASGQGADCTPRPRAPWWIHLCAASFLGYFGLVQFSAFYPPDFGGIEGIDNARPDGVIVTRVAADSEAGRAGVQPGDRILAINGRRLRSLSEAFAFNGSVSVGREITWLFERSGRQFSVIVTPYRGLSPVSLGLLPVSVGLLASLVLSFVVIYSRPKDRVARLGALLLASIACLAAPPGPSGLARTWGNLPVLVGALLWPASLITLTIGPIMFSFFAVFPRSVVRRQWIWIAALVPGAVLTAWFGFYQMVFVYQPERSRDLYPPAWSTVVGMAIGLAYFAAGMAILVWNYRRLTDLNERRRVRVLSLGMTVASVGLLYAVVTVVIMNLGLRSGSLGNPAAVGVQNVIGGLLVVALPCAFAYAILAQRLFDIRVIIRQGLQYAFARRSILLLVPALVAGLVVDLLVHAERPLIDILQSRGWVYATLGGLAAVAYVNRDAWMAALDHRFFRERYDAHQILRQVVEDVRAVPRLDTVAPAWSRA
jgi:hypothetical protein